MVQPVLDALLEQRGHFLHRGRAEILADRVAPQRQRQARLVVPPLSQIDDQRQPLIGIGQLAFVNDQPGVHLLLLDQIEDLIEGLDLVREVIAQQQPQRQKGGGQLAGNGDVPIA